MTKKEALEFAKARLSQGFSEVTNYGKIFICHGCYGCILRDVIYYIYKDTGLAVDVFSVDIARNNGNSYSYFVGSKEHAEALQEAFGGRVYSSDTSGYASTPEYEAWIHEAKLSEHVTDQEILDILI